MDSPLHREAETALRAELRELRVPQPDAVPLDSIVAYLALDEDITFEFLPRVEKRLGLHREDVDWEQVLTLGDAVEMLANALARTRAPSERPPNA